MLATELFLGLTIFLGGPSTLLFWQMTSLHLGMQWALEKISWLLFVELYLQNLRNSAKHSLCVYSMYIQCSTLNMIPLLDVKIEMQKITDTQFILSISIHMILKLIYFEKLLFFWDYLLIYLIYIITWKCETHLPWGPHQTIFLMQNEKKNLI